MEIECFIGHRFVHSPAAPPILCQSLFSNSIHRNNKNGSLNVTAKICFHENDAHGHLFSKSAISRASYRFQEALRPGKTLTSFRHIIEHLMLKGKNILVFQISIFKNAEPLFVDPYAGCFVPPDLDLELDKNLEQKHHHYCIGTRFIDDKLLNATKGADGAKQVVMFTDGMDSRAYRLNWPSSTVIYDVSPQSVFSISSQKLQDVGAKIPRSCLLLHVPLESSDMQQLLRDKGFNGSRPSIWIFQGFPVTNLASFKEILFMVGNLAMKGCLFVGEFPLWLTENDEGAKVNLETWMYEVFMSYGFRVQIIGYDDVARSLGRERVEGIPDNLLFVAEHLRFSDDQMETWRTEFQRVEEEGDEEGFDEL